MLFSFSLLILISLSSQRNQTFCRRLVFPHPPVTGFRKSEDPPREQRLEPSGTPTPAEQPDCWDHLDFRGK